MKRLTEEGFQSAAQTLGVEVAAIKAVAEVESRGDGFLPDGRPVILFERHKFHRFTKGKYDDHPDISNAKAGGYGKGGSHQWDRYDRAYQLDPRAAMMSASWGKFQIMGFNYGSAGFDTVQDFVEAMNISEDEQLQGFVNFILNEGLADSLKDHDWEAFAEAYNGEDYKENQYDTKLAAAYKKYKRTTLAPQLEVKPVDTDKGVTTGTEPPSETAGTPPPAPAAEVKASQPSWFTRIGSLSVPASTMAILTAIGKFFIGLPPWAWVVIVVASMVIGYLIWREAKRQAHERTLKVMDAAADKEKNNLRLV